MMAGAVPRTGLSSEPIGASGLALDVDPEAGAVVCFEGRVRAMNEGRRVSRLHYDAYAEMAESVMAGILSDVRGKYDVKDIRLQHRIGTLEVGETAVVVVVAAPHRTAAFDAAREVMERVKREVPIWKREEYADGSERWLGEAP